MTRDEFEQALDRFGPDLDGWPAGIAERARTCLAGDADARRAWQAARRVDAHLAELCEHAAHPDLAGRIRAQVRRIGAPPDHVDRVLGWLTGRLWRPALLAMLIATAGFLTGMSVSDPVDPELAEDVMTLAFSDIYSELENAEP